MVEQNSQKGKKKPSNLCPEGWVGKVMGEGKSVLDRRRSMCKGPEVVPPFITPGTSLLCNTALITSVGLSFHRIGSS